MGFDPDPTTQAQKVNFSRKTAKKIHPKIFFSDIPVSKVYSQKHLGLRLDSKLSFEIYAKTILTKVNRIIRLLQKFRQILPRPSLITIYKAFITPHLDCEDVIFNLRLESIQHNAALAISGVIRETSKEKFYEKLGF